MDIMLDICTPWNPWICMFPADWSEQKKKKMVRMGDACSGSNL